MGIRHAHIAKSITWRKFSLQRWKLIVTEGQVCCSVCEKTTTLHHSQFNHKLWVMVQLIKVWENQPKNIFPIFIYFSPLHVRMHVTHLISFCKTMACLFRLLSSIPFALLCNKKIKKWFSNSPFKVLTSVWVKSHVHFHASFLYSSMFCFGSTRHAFIGY